MQAIFCGMCIHVCNPYTRHWDSGAGIILRIHSQVFTVLLRLDLACFDSATSAERKT